MKLTSLILSATTLLSCFAMTACQNGTTPNPVDPFGDVPAASGTTKNPNDYQGDPKDWLDHLLENSDYDPNAPHGELKLYGTTFQNRFEPHNGMYIKTSGYGLVYFSHDEPQKYYKLCFDPVCSHDTGDFMETCQAHINSYVKAPTGVPQVVNPVCLIVDLYDTTAAPVLYLAYMRNDFYYVNEVIKEREPLYCIERYDLSKGTRTVVADGLKDEIQKLFTYGDYIYYVASNANFVEKICRIPKAGGEIETLKGDETIYRIETINNQKLYYIADNQYLYRCNLDFTSTEKLMDLSKLKGYDADEAMGVDSRVVGNYLYYYADLQKVAGSYSSNYYRIPLNDLEAEPQRIAENIIYGQIRFSSEGTMLYYQPAVFERVENSLEYTSFNESNGTIYALDLNTLEQTTVCENIGINIDFNSAYEDKVVFSAKHAYNAEGKRFAKSGDQIIGTKYGTELEIWCNTLKVEFVN